MCYKQNQLATNASKQQLHAGRLNMHQFYVTLSEEVHEGGVHGGQRPSAKLLIRVTMTGDEWGGTTATACWRNVPPYGPQKRVFFGHEAASRRRLFRSLAAYPTLLGHL